MRHSERDWRVIQVLLTAFNDDSHCFRGAIWRGAISGRNNPDELPTEGALRVALHNHWLRETSTMILKLQDEGVQYLEAIGLVTNDGKLTDLGTAITTLIGAEQDISLTRATLQREMPTELGAIKMVGQCKNRIRDAIHSVLGKEAADAFVRFARMPSGSGMVEEFEDALAGFKKELFPKYYDATQLHFEQHSGSDSRPKVYGYCYQNDPHENIEIREWGQLHGDEFYLCFGHTGLDRLEVHLASWLRKHGREGDCKGVLLSTKLCSNRTTLHEIYKAAQSLELPLYATFKGAIPFCSEDFESGFTQHITTFTEGFAGIYVEGQANDIHQVNNRVDKVQLPPELTSDADEVTIDVTVKSKNES